MAEGFRGLRPFLAADGNLPEVFTLGASSSASSVSGVGTISNAGAVASASSATAVKVVSTVCSGASSSGAEAAGVRPTAANEGFVSYRPWFGVSGMGGYVGWAAAGAEVTGATAQEIVRVGEAFAGAEVTGRNASIGGQEAFFTYRPWFGLQGSTVPVPGGASWSAASVTGDGVTSVMGDYATPLRTVFALPPPVEFKPPGTTLDYGLPTSLRPAGSTYAELLASSTVSGQRRAAYSFVVGSSGASAVTGQLRAVVAFAGEASAGARVTGAAVGVITLVETGAASAGADVAGQDRSLSPGAALGIAEATSNAQAEGFAEFTQSGAAGGVASVHAVDVSGYPMAAPAGSSSAAADVAGEAVATIVAVAASECAAAVAAVQATFVIAEAAVSSLAHVTAVNLSVTTVVPGGGRWPRSKPRHDRSTRPGERNTRRPVSNSS